MHGQRLWSLLEATEIGTLGLDAVRMPTEYSATDTYHGRCDVSAHVGESSLY